MSFLVPSLFCHYGEADEPHFFSLKRFDAFFAAIIHRFLLPPRPPVTCRLLSHHFLARRQTQGKERSLMDDRSRKEGRKWATFNFPKKR